MFCNDCNNDRNFHKTSTEITCMNCGLVIVTQILDDKCYYTDTSCGVENNITEMLNKYGLSESYESRVSEYVNIMKQKKAFKGDNNDFLIHACISIVCNVDNTHMFSSKYIKVLNKVVDAININEDDTSKQNRKQWANDMILFNSLIVHNISTFDKSHIRKEAYNIYEKLPYDIPQLSTVKEKSIFLTIIFITLNNMKPSEFANHNDISSTSIMKIKRIIKYYLN